MTLVEKHNGIESMRWFKIELCRSKILRLSPFAVPFLTHLWALIYLKFILQVEGEILQKIRWMKIYAQLFALKYVMMVERSLGKVRKIVPQNVWRYYYKNVFLSC